MVDGDSTASSLSLLQVSHGFWWCLFAFSWWWKCMRILPSVSVGHQLLHRRRTCFSAIESQIKLQGQDLLCRLDSICCLLRNWENKLLEPTESGVLSAECMDITSIPRRGCARKQTLWACPAAPLYWILFPVRLVQKVLGIALSLYPSSYCIESVLDPAGESVVSRRASHASLARWRGGWKRDFSTETVNPVTHGPILHEKCERNYEGSR